MLIRVVHLSFNDFVEACVKNYIIFMLVRATISICLWQCKVDVSYSMMSFFQIPHEPI